MVISNLVPHLDNSNILRRSIFTNPTLDVKLQRKWTLPNILSTQITFEQYVMEKISHNSAKLPLPRIVSNLLGQSWETIN